MFIVVGRIKNLFFNPLSDNLGSMNDLIDLLDRAFKLISDLPILLKNTTYFDYNSFEGVVNGYEDWILNLIGMYIY